MTNSHGAPPFQIQSTSGETSPKLTQPWTGLSQPPRKKKVRYWLNPDKGMRMVMSGYQLMAAVQEQDLEVI